MIILFNEEMKMKKIRVFIVFLVFSAIVFSSNRLHFYNLKTVKTIKGTVYDFKVEEGRRGRSRFFYLYIKNKKGEQYKVELCPEWFLKKDFWAGLNVEITGSIVGSKNNVIFLIAREVNYFGETIEFRDKYGFPLWRGLRMRGNAEQGKRKGERGR